VVPSVNKDLGDLDNHEIGENVEFEESDEDSLASMVVVVVTSEHKAPCCVAKCETSLFAFLYGMSKRVVLFL
jgi:hypothetical protein